MQMDTYVRYLVEDPSDFLVQIEIIPKQDGLDELRIEIRTLRSPQEIAETQSLPGVQIRTYLRSRNLAF